jgi:hypothetical protein
MSNEGAMNHFAIMLLADSVNKEMWLIVGFHDTAHHTPTI